MNAASAKAIYLLLQHLRGIEDLWESEGIFSLKTETSGLC